MTEKDVNEYTVLENTIIYLSKRIAEIEHTLDNNRKMLRRNLFACILLNSIDDTHKLYDFMKLVSIEMSYPYFGVILLKLSSIKYYDNFKYKKNLQYIEDEINDLIGNSKEPGFACYAACIQSYYDKGYICILFNAEKQDREWIMEKAERVYLKLKKYFKLEIKASVGRIVTDLKDVRLSREDAEILMKYTFFESGDNVILGDLSILNRELSNDIIPDYLFERYNKALRKLDIASIQKNVADILLEMKTKNYSETYCMAKLREIVNACVKKLELHAKINYNSREVYEKIMSSSNIDELQTKLFKEVEKVLGCVSYEKMDECEKTIKTAQELVNIAKNYIVENLDKDVSLLTVSDYLGVSPQYLSKLFKEETGENFVNFVTKKRMEKAKTIIDTNKDINIEEVCSLVGYNNTSYFIKKFKEIYNLTPNSYRNIAKTNYLNFVQTNKEKMYKFS